MEAALDAVIQELIEAGVTGFYAGGALGFDTMAAEAVLRAKETQPEIKLILAIPCHDQTKGWRKRDIQRYDAICKQADEVHVLADTYDSGCMMRRNRFMVDHSRHCVFYLVNRRSGTYGTVKYAMEQEHALYNIFFYNK